MKRSDVTDAMVCAAYVEWSQRKAEFVDAILCRTTGAPVKVVYAAMERAYDRDLVECGVSLRSGWLTDKGLALLGLERKPFDAPAAMVEIRRAWLQVAKGAG